MDFVIAFIISSSIIFVFLSIMNRFIQLYLCVFFAHAGEMASVYDQIDVKDEPLFPAVECDQVGSVLYDPYVYYWFNIRNLSLAEFIHKYISQAAEIQILL